MTKRFSKKSVALFLLSIIVCGFFSFGIFDAVKAAAPSPGQAAGTVIQYTDPNTKAVYYYAGNGNWHTPTLSGPNVTSVGTQELQNSHGMPNNYQADAIKAYDGTSVAVTHQDWFGLILSNPSQIPKQAALDVVYYWLQLWLIPLASFFLTITANILDIAIKYSIYGGAFNSFKDTAQTIWTLTRDVCNIFFIFTLLYIAIRQIVGQIGAELKGKLAAIVIAALLINFSLFFTEIVIDASNMVASALLNQIIATSTPLPPGNLAAQAINTVAGLGTTVDKSDPRIASRIMNGLGLQTIYQGSSLENPAVSTPILIASAMTFLLFLVTMFVFLFMALLLIGRLVMLIFLMATAPLGFMSGTVPFLDKAASGWRDELLNQAILAPVFVFFMLLIMKVMIAIQSIPATQATLSSNPVVSKGVIVWFDYVLIIYLLIKAVSITKGLSGEIGKIANQAATAATGLALGAATGSTALIGRQLVGRAAAGLAANEGLKAATSDENRNFLTRFGARMTLKGAVKTSEATMDVRHTNAAKETFGFLKGQGIDITGSHAKGAEGGYAGAVKRGAEEETKFAKEVLNRNSLTDSKALSESLKKLPDVEMDIDKAMVNMQNAQADWVTENAKANKDETKLARLLAEVDKNQKEIGIKQKLVNDTRTANERDQFGALVDTKESREARERVIENVKKTYQAGYADVVEHGIYSTLAGYNKAAAVKIRKEVVGANPTADLIKAMKAVPGFVPPDDKDTSKTTTPPPPPPPPPASGPTTI